MILYLIVGLIFGMLFGMPIGHSLRGESKSAHPELERVATLLLMSNNLKEIREFARSKVSYLHEKTFAKLCAKIEELNADAAINEDETTLKVRIASLEDKEIELKKIQAEGFMETLKTIKKMCR